MITICNRPALFLLVKPAKHCGFYNSKGEAMPPKQRRVIHEHHQKNAERHGADGRSANFYSRHTRGATKSQACCRGVAEISTHAPARGATYDRGVADACPHISTHAPARGATRPAGSPQPAHRDFYSRPCERGDRSLRSTRKWSNYFYSRPCERGDKILH